jgi:uncharacterized membrane protein YdjX (TVP38/TMEM64 family)
VGNDDDENKLQALVLHGPWALVPRPRTRRWIVACWATSLIGLVVLVACGLTATEGPWDWIGLLLFLPFLSMAIEGTLWWRRTPPDER